MSSKNLERLSSEINAKIGIEYEFVFEHINEDDGDLKEKEDTEVIDIPHITSFFEDSYDEIDYTMLAELDEYLDQQFDEWHSEKFQEYINNKKNKEAINSLLVKYYVSRNKKTVERNIEDNLDKITKHDKEFYDAFRWHKSMSTSYLYTTNEKLESELEKYSFDGLKTYYEARKPVYEKIEKELFDLLQDKNSDVYHFSRMNTARNLFTERLFLKDIYGPNISDVYEKIRQVEGFEDLSWPLIYPESDNDNLIEKAAEKLEEYNDSLIGRYEVTTDTSIIVDDESTEVGIEIKNEMPLTLEETIYDFKTILDYISNNGYLNDSTGLHINVSTNNFNRYKLDYTKLVLLLGDKYILEKFSRLGNRYTESSLEKLTRDISETEKNDILNKLQSKLNQIAKNILDIHLGDKYVSVNLRKNRVEFRGLGGDWLDREREIIDTIMRFVIILDAALDPDKYKEEYAKKLYKWINPPDEYSDTIKVFSMLQSNMIPLAAAKSYIRKIQRERPTHYMFGSKNQDYVWGSGKTKQEALIDAKNEVEKQQENWETEFQLGRLYPTDKNTHDKIQDGNTFSFTKVGNIFVED